MSDVRRKMASDAFFFIQVSSSLQHGYCLLFLFRYHGRVLCVGCVKIEDTGLELLQAFSFEILIRKSFFVAELSQLMVVFYFDYLQILYRKIQPTRNFLRHISLYVNMI